MSEFPSANIIARAIVTAAREMDEDPEAIVLRLPRHRSRYYAMFALAHAYPEARKSSLARCCGAPGSCRWRGGLSFQGVFGTNMRVSCFITS